MHQVLGLRKVADTEPQEYELRLHDTENEKSGYVMTTTYGTDSEVRVMLKDAGWTESRIDMLFAQAA